MELEPGLYIWESGKVPYGRALNLNAEPYPTDADAEAAMAALVVADAPHKIRVTRVAQPETVEGAKYVDGRRIVDVAEAAHDSGVADRTLYNWMDNNTVEYVRDTKGTVYVFRDTLYEGGFVPKENHNLLSIREACNLVGVSRRTMYIWLSEGKLKYKRNAAGHIRIFEGTLFSHDTPVPQGTKSLLSTDDVMEREGVCRGTVYNMMKRGELQYVRTVGGGIRILGEDLPEKNQAAGEASSKA